MGLWGTTDQNADKPQHLVDNSAAPENNRKSKAVGIDTSEASSNEVGHAGWCVPAGGNDNSNAQRECIATTRNISSDNDSLS